MQNLTHNIWLILFIGWGIPLTWFRSKFRKIVYNTTDWKINIKPVFKKEILALLGNTFPENLEYIKFRNKYRIYLSIYLILFVFYFNEDIFSQSSNSKGMENVVVGSKVPDFNLLDQNGNLFRIKDLLGAHNLVIYFYPKDDSPGCTKQACSFRDQYEVFKEEDAVIIGISSQSPASHKEFEKKYNLNYTLLSDNEDKVRKLFGVPTNLFGLIPGRVTYIVNKKGEVVYIFNSQLQAQQHVTEAIRILKGIK
jgi:peroxiredoxin Q/BCP